MSRLKAPTDTFRSDRTAFQPLVRTTRLDHATDADSVWRLPESVDESWGAVDKSDYTLHVLLAGLPLPPPTPGWVIRVEGEGLEGEGRGIRFKVSGRRALALLSCGGDREEDGMDEAVAACGLGWGLLEGGLVLHSSSVIWQGKAHLFLGHSGIGKTTLARWASENGADLLSVDQTLVVPTGESGQWVAVSCDSGSRRRIPLGSLSVLRRGSHTLREPMEQPRALRSVLPNVLLWQGASELHSMVLERTVRLVGDCATYGIQVHLPSLSMEALFRG